jgi:hypothetical protein
MENKYKAILQKYIPLESVDQIYNWIVEYKIQFKISRNRKTKLGDFRAPYNGKGFQISVNYDLNKYAFLITFVHEFAHLVTWKQHKNSVKPHGEEWIQNFRSLMQPFIEKNIFPMDVQIVLISHLQKGFASSTSDVELYSVLKNYDNKINNTIDVDSVPIGEIFILEDGRKFRKIRKLRKRIECTNIDNGRNYIVQPHMPVILLKKNS